MQGKLERYNDIIQSQLSQGIVEHTDEVVKDGREFYISHKVVVCKIAESTEIRIVYDASARVNASVPSLNECLEIGPSLQNQLWNVLVRCRFYLVAIAGDLKQDALRFHRIKDMASKQVETSWFTRVLFGLVLSPLLLGTVIKEHLQRYKMVNMELVEKIECSKYVDGLISGGETTKQALEIKITATAIFGEATFKLHKWHSNNRELEVETATSDEESQSYAKQQLGTRKGESKLLGVPWDKEKDEIQVSFPILLNDKNTTIFNLKYRKSFLILVSRKGLEILYYFKPFLQKNYKKAGWLLLIPFGSLILKVEFGHVFLVMIVKLTWKQLFSFYGN